MSKKENKPSGNRNPNPYGEARERRAPAYRLLHSKKFWLVTVISAIIIQSAFAGAVISMGEMGTGDGVFLALLVAAGIAGPVIFNLKTYREKIWDYVISIALSPLSSLAMIAALAVLSFAASILMVIAILAVIFSILNG